MKLLIPFILISYFGLAADLKSLPNQAGNGNIDLAGTVILDSKEIQQILGTPMESGYVVVKIKVSPRTVAAIRISPENFELVSRKDGERSPALAPDQIGGRANLVLKSKTSYDGSPGVSSTAVALAPSDAKTGPEKPEDSALRKILEAKILPDKETKEPVEGLLYFLLQGKNKPKDLGLLYKGPAGHLAMDFK